MDGKNPPQELPGIAGPERGRDQAGDFPPNRPQSPQERQATGGGGTKGGGRLEARILRAARRFQRGGSGWGESWGVAASKAEAICTNARLQFGKGKAGERNK